MTGTEKPTVGFIGAGRMATAMAIGLVKSFTDVGLLTASDPSEVAREQFSRTTGCGTTASSSEGAAQADIVVLAVKPQYVGAVASEVAQLKSHQLLVSVVAGVRLQTLHALFGETTRIVRVMPNTPALIGAGISAVVTGAEPADVELAKTMMATVGEVVGVSESQIDAVTGVSGSGPAYVYQFIEALSDGGVRVGLPRDMATKLAAQTVLGAARMVLETGQHPGVLKDAVASPGGTTIAAIHELERGGMRAAVMNAVVAAKERSVQLGES